MEEKTYVELNEFDSQNSVINTSAKPDVENITTHVDELKVKNLLIIWFCSLLTVSVVLACSITVNSLYLWENFKTVWDSFYNLDITLVVLSTASFVIMIASLGIIVIKKCFPGIWTKVLNFGAIIAMYLVMFGAQLFAISNRTTATLNYVTNGITFIIFVGVFLLIGIGYYVIKKNKRKHETKIENNPKLEDYIPQNPTLKKVIDIFRDPFFITPSWRKYLNWIKIGGFSLLITLGVISYVIVIIGIFFYGGMTDQLRTIVGVISIGGGVIFAILALISVFELFTNSHPLQKDVGLYYMFEKVFEITLFTCSAFTGINIGVCAILPNYSINPSFLSIPTSKKPKLDTDSDQHLRVLV